MNDIAYGEQLTTERLNESNGRWERLACEGIEWCGHDAFMQYIDDITEATTLKQQLQTAKDRYELAIESAELGVWEYHIQEHTITSPSKSFDKFGIMGTIADVPQSIVPLVVEEDRPKLLNLFRRLDAGERKVSEDIWMRWHPDAPLRCERVIYSLVEERDGKPAVAYGLGINVTLEKQEQQRYHELLQSLLVANPEALCAFELNLMRNTCGEGHGKSPFVMNLLSSSTADGLFRNVTAIIPSESDSDRFNAVFNRENLVRSFEEGRTSLSVDYHRLGEDGEPFWVRTYISMLRNPDTQDVTGIMYSVDISAEKRRDEIMNIITSQEYDLIALLHTDTDRFDAIFIGDSLPSGYRRFLPEAGASCSFSELCEYAAAHWVDRGRSRALCGGCLRRVRPREGTLRGSATSSPSSSTSTRARARACAVATSIIGSSTTRMPSSSSSPTSPRPTGSSRRPSSRRRRRPAGSRTSSTPSRAASASFTCPIPTTSPSSTSTSRCSASSGSPSPTMTSPSPPSRSPPWSTPTFATRSWAFIRMTSSASRRPSMTTTTRGTSSWTTIAPRGRTAPTTGSARRSRCER
jgi:PAS domain-containing protein